MQVLLGPGRRSSSWHCASLGADALGVQGPGEIKYWPSYWPTHHHHLYQRTSEIELWLQWGVWEAQPGSPEHQASLQGWPPTGERARWAGKPAGDHRGSFFHSLIP